jgi:hypothetical protein
MAQSAPPPPSRVTGRRAATRGACTPHAWGRQGNRPRVQWLQRVPRTAPAMAQIRSRPSDLPTRWPHTPPRCPRRPCARWGPWRDTRQEARHAATAPPSPAGGGLPHAPRPLGCGPQGEEHPATARLPGSVPPCSRTVGQAVWGVPQTDGGICPGGPHPASARPSAAPAGPSGHGPGVGGHVSCLRWVVWRLGSAHGFSGVFLPRAQPLTPRRQARATAPPTPTRRKSVRCGPSLARPC